MNHKSLPGRLAGKPWVRIMVIAIILLIVTLGLLFMNALYGNPIRKWMAQSTCLSYFEEGYHQAFTLHEIEYWSKLPGYVLILSPENDPESRFTCNPNCEPICYSDEYGGVLASGVLIEQVKSILEPEYAHLDLQITAAEDPFTVFGGEHPDFFEKDPHVRLTKNHQDLSITWVDPAITADEFPRVPQNIADLVEAHLPSINPNLQLSITVYPDKNKHLTRYVSNFFLFPTLNIEE